MGKEKTKKINISNLLKYVALILLALCVTAYFLPLLTYTSPASFKTTNYSGFDFTIALIFDSQSEKVLAIKQFFEAESTHVSSYVIAIFAIISCVYSLAVFVLTSFSFFNKKLNNVIVLAGLFVVWIVLLIAVVSFVGSMAITKGDYVLNNYTVSFGTIIGIFSMFVSVVLNVVANFVLK